MEVIIVVVASEQLERERVGLAAVIVTRSGERGQPKRNESEDPSYLLRYERARTHTRSMSRGCIRASGNPAHSRGRQCLVRASKAAGCCRCDRRSSLVSQKQPRKRKMFVVLTNIFMGEAADFARSR